LRVYNKVATAHAFQLVAAECNVASLSSRIGSLPTGAVGQDAFSDREAVRRAYANTVNGGPNVLPGDCGDAQKRSELLGYREGEILESADLGLGCGNPLLTAKLVPGEVVLDLGSGAGIDCFAAAKQVGPTGHVIGVDMTPEMLSKARKTAANEGMKNVSFRLGEIEHLPVGDAVVNCLISNCVINLSTEKAQVYKEMNRVLVPGGRVSISDVLRTSEIPTELKTMESLAC
jgi:SAM-dependent methyltransferase